MSGVWQHFDKIGENKDFAICKICKAKLKYSGRTGCLWNHLARHTTVSQIAESNGESSAARNSEVDNLLTNFITRRSTKRKPICEEPSSSPGCSSDSSNITITTEEQPTTPKQTKITETFFSGRNLKNRQEMITASITKMIAEDMLPISFVEGPGFRNLMKAIVPQYVVPSRNTIRARLGLLYEFRRNEVFQAVQRLPYVALTTDCWTSRNTESYITVTLHGISTDWKHVGYTLTTEHLRENHTADNLRKKLEDIIITWKLEEKVVAVVHDNAANIVNAITSSQYIPASICCFAHSLQLAINKGFDVDGIKSLLSKCSSVVGHFRHSNTATEALRKMQNQLNLPEHKLIQNVKVRWNSTVFMVERLLEQRQALVGVLTNRSVTSKAHAITYEVTENEWMVLENLKNVLAPFATATTYMSSESSPTVSIIQSITQSLLRNYLSVKPTDTREVKSFKIIVSENFKTRFNIGPTKANQSEFFDIATFLDPRYKNKERSSGVIAKVKRYLENLIEVENLGELKEKRTSTHEDAINVLFPDEIVNNIENKEVDKYFLEEEIPKQLSPLEWWKSNETRYPAVVGLARRYLCAPAERVFSSAGNIVSAKRSSLQSHCVNMLIFLYQNKQ